MPSRNARHRLGSAFETTFSGLEPGAHNVAVTLSANGQKGSAAATSFYFRSTRPLPSQTSSSHTTRPRTPQCLRGTPRRERTEALDTDNLRYKIERIPGNVIVARSAKGILSPKRPRSPGTATPTALRPTSVRLTSQARAHARTQKRWARPRPFRSTRTSTPRLPSPLSH